MTVNDQLKTIREQLQDARQRRGQAARDRDAAKEAFGKVDFAATPEWMSSREFTDAETAVKNLGEIEDQINGLQQQENALLRIVGSNSSAVDPVTRNGNGPSPDIVISGRDGHSLLAQSEAYSDAMSRGLFHSKNRFGTIDLGEICGRDGFGQFLAAYPQGPVGPATPGPVTTPAYPTGWVAPDARGVVAPRLLPLNLLDLIPTGTTDSNIVQYVQVTGTPQSAAETAELGLKPQVGLTTVDATAPVRTIAGYIKVSRQALDDMAGLGTMINTLLPHDVRRRVMMQILYGDGQGQDLLGILNTSGIGTPSWHSGDTAADAILRSITTVVLSDNDPNFVCLNPQSPYLPLD